FMAVGTNGTIAGTPVALLNRFDGSPANTSIASKVVPAGAIVLDQGLQPKSQYADVLQVFLEEEVAAMTAPAAVTNKFPYGFVTRNPATPNSRTLPASPPVGQFDGLVTFAFRVPLQPSDQGTTNGATKDPFSI